MPVKRSHTNVPDILKKIVEARELKIACEKAQRPFETLLDAIGPMPGPRSFSQAVAQQGLTLIGEVKRASPSKGLIREDFDPLRLARQYESSVDALSVLTEQDFFKGHPDYLSHIHDQCSLPLLRKDFIIDPYQIYEARALGASCILLIAAILQDSRLKEFQALAGELSMDCLVEVHDEGELDQALSTGAALIGINNRDLHTFEVDLNVTKRLSAYIPDHVFLVSESGVLRGADVAKLGKRIDGILVGEAFMRAASIPEKAWELRRAYEIQD